MRLCTPEAKARQRLRLTTSAGEFFFFFSGSEVVSPSCVKANNETAKAGRGSEEREIEESRRCPERRVGCCTPPPPLEAGEPLYEQWLRSL